MRPPVLAALLLASTVAIPAGAQPRDPAAERWWAHIRVLADDGMEGRLTGSQRAADYVAAQFKTFGLQPAGSAGYFQPVAFKAQRVRAERSSAALVEGRPRWTPDSFFRRFAGREALARGGQGNPK